MLVQTSSIYGLKRSEYDDLLSQGWFRGNGIVYRSEVVCIDSKVYGIRNIRFPVSSFSMRRSHRKLFLQNQKKFTIRIGTPQCDASREELYQGLKSRFKAFVHENLEGVLLSPRQGAEFDAMEIAVYDGSELIAVSYVDVGDRSMASILCIYSREYAKCSLGVYTMLVELDLAKRLGLDFYYPGYVLDEPSAFDYKLELGPCQWLSHADVWCNDVSQIHPSKANRIRTKMEEIETLLKKAGYEPNLQRPDLIRVPSFYTLETAAGLLALAFDLQMDSFLCFDVHTVDDLDFLQSLHLSDDYAKGPNYVLEPKRCTFFHQIRADYFLADLHHIIQLLTHANLVVE
jgi:arginyl-tRNA--protein-N-Asp/Glu arginylyltransferase